MSRHPAYSSPVQRGRKCGAEREPDPRLKESATVRKYRGRAFRLPLCSSERRRNECLHSVRCFVESSGRAPRRGQRGSRALGHGRDDRAGRRKDTAVRDWVDVCTGGRRSPSADAVAAWPSPDRHQRRHPLGSRLAAVAEGDLAKHHQRLQCTLGQIVGRWNTRVVQEDSHWPACLRIRFCRVGLSLVQGAGFQPRQLLTQPLFFCRQLLRREFAPPALMIEVAAAVDPLFEIRKERAGRRLGRHHLLPIAGGAGQVRQPGKRSRNRCSAELPGSLAAGGTRLRRNHGEAADVPTIGTLGLQVEREQAGDHRHRGRDPVTVRTR